MTSIERSRNKKTRLITVIIATLLIVSFAPHTCLAYSGGSGTVGAPYQIANVADFQQLSSTPTDWNKSFILTADINLAGLTFSQAPIAPDLTTATGFLGTKFTGIFNGNDHIIFNLTITSAQDYIGLFGYVGSGSVISNLGVENVNITGKEFVGGLVGYEVYSTITNCHSTGSVSSRTAGGLVGYQSYGTISNSYSTCSVNSSSYSAFFVGPYAGGLVGYQNYGTISNSYSTGSVNSSSDYYNTAGGLVGYQYGGTITNCYSTGSVLCYRYYGDGDYGESYAGGLVGYKVYSTITNCYSTGSVTSTNASPSYEFYTGGLVGRQFGGIISNCYSTGTVTTNGSGIKFMGGLVGSGGGVINGFWDTQTSGLNYSAGGNGRTTAQLKQAANYIGWNTPAQTHWTINENADYPQLAWQNQQGTPLSAQTLSNFVPGAGTTSDPYRISTPQQLNIVGLYSDEWSKTFSLENDIDLSSYIGTEFNRIGVNSSKDFSGTFNGNGYIIRNLTYTTTANTHYVGLFGCTSNATIENLGVENAIISTAGSFAGCLVGEQFWGTIAKCYSTGSVSTTNYYTPSSRIGTGGLVGCSDGIIKNCYSASSVTSNSSFPGSYLLYIGAGGLVGYQGNDTSAKIEQCYSTGQVSDTTGYNGGLLGSKMGSNGIVAACFWDTQTSGLTTSAAGTGKTTDEMQTLTTFASAGWDFVGEIINGTEDIWSINEGVDYPKLTWQSVQQTRIISLSGNMAFGDVQVGQTATRTLTISNSGNSTLAVSSISYPSGFSGAYSGNISAGGSTSVSVTFAPISAASYGGTITVNSNNTSGTNTINASGNGIPALTRIIGLSGNMAFGDVQVGQTATRTLTISNSGNSTLAVSSISYPTGFSGAYSGNIPTGGSDDVIVTFAPAAETSYGGTITVNSNNTSGTNTIDASGTGIPQQIQTGNLTVTLGPAGAVSAGAQWNVDGGVWQDSLATVTGLSAGSHTINYKTIAGWTAPVSEQVTISDGQTNSISRDYIQLTYTLNLNRMGSGSVKVNSTLHSLPWSESFTPGTIVTLEAVADSNWQFSEWTGDITDVNNPTSVIMNSDWNITAEFISYNPPCRFGSFDGKKNVKLTLQDCNSNNVTFMLTGGGYGEIDCQDCTFSNITLYDTTEKSILSIKTKGNVGTSFGNIISNGPLKGINAKNVDILGSIEIGSSTNPKAAVMITFDQAYYLEIDSKMPIKSISATEWLGGSIYAPSIGSITIKGDKKRGISGDLYDVDLILSQQPDVKKLALGKLTVKGWIDSSRILSQGNIGTVTAGAIIDSTCFAGVTDTNDSDTDGVLDLPDPAVHINYVEPATIKKITIKSIKGEPYPYYINSNIAAAQILGVYLAYPEYENGGVVFGIAADYIKALKIKDSEGTESWKKLDKPGDAPVLPGNAEILLYEP